MKQISNINTTRVLEYLSQVTSVQNLTHALNDSMLWNNQEANPKENATLAKKILDTRKKLKGGFRSVEQLSSFDLPALQALIKHINASRLTVEHFLLMYQEGILEKWQERGDYETNCSFKDSKSTKDGDEQASKDADCGCGGTKPTAVVEKKPVATGTPKAASCNEAFLPANFFKPTMDTFVKKVRVNLVILQKLDGSGNFNEFDPKHNKVFDNAENRCNLIYRDVAATNPGPTCNTLSHSRVQFEFNRIYVRHETLWNLDVNWPGGPTYSGPTTYACPSDSNWPWENLYQQLKAQEPCDEEAITILLVNSGVNLDAIRLHEFYYELPPGSGQWLSPSINYISWNAQHSPWVSGCSIHANNNPHHVNRKHVIICKNSYYDYIRQSRIVRYADPVSPEWMVGADLGSLLAHEIGHTLMDNHIHYPSTSCGNNLMSGTSWGRTLEQDQLINMQEVLSKRDLRRCVVEDHPERVITGTQTWDTNTKVFGDIRIPAGARLMLTCELEMPGGGRIIVERGGRLDVDGGRIVSRCKPWRGIEVHGHASKPHPTVGAVLAGSYPSNEDDHGVLYLQGAILENARHAVTLTRYESWGADLNYSGGIVLAANSAFTNNYRAVEFVQYKYDNSSNFANCTFETDPSKLLYFHFDPLAFVTLWNVKDVKFAGCTFINRDVIGATYGLGERGKGIYSINAQYELTDVTGGAGAPTSNEFINLTHAIEGKATNAAYQDIRITETFFDNNYRAVTMTGITGVVLNNIECLVGSEVSYYSDEYAYGVFFEACASAWVVDSSFDIAASSVGSRYGVLYKNCLGNASVVYRSSFKALTCSVRSIGDNIGLLIKCNVFDSVLGDVYIDRDPAGQITGQIGTIQSTMPSISTANNIFSSVCNHLGQHLHFDPFNANSFFYLVPQVNSAMYTPTCIVNKTPVIISWNQLPDCPLLPIFKKQQQQVDLDKDVESLLKQVGEEQYDVVKRHLTEVKWTTLEEQRTLESVRHLRKTIQMGGVHASAARIKLAHVLLQRGERPTGQIKQLALMKDATIQEQIAYLQIAVKAKGKNGLPRLTQQQEAALKALAAANGAASIYAKSLLELVAWVNRAR